MLVMRLGARQPAMNASKSGDWCKLCVLYSDEYGPCLTPGHHVLNTTRQSDSHQAPKYEHQTLNPCKVTGRCCTTLAGPPQGVGSCGCARPLSAPQTTAIPRPALDKHLLLKAPPWAYTASMSSPRPGSLLW